MNMLTWSVRLCLLFALLPTLARAAEPEVDPTLARYVAAPDASFAWKELQRTQVPGGELVELRMTSQTWKGIAWKHQLILFKPEVVEHPENALFVIGGGRWSAETESGPAKIPSQVKLMTAIAGKLKAPVAVLAQVPFQPIFNDLREDVAIAYTFRKYLDGGDADWPLLLPMVKSVARGMDVMQAFCQSEWGFMPKRFLMTGGSKRGWTTYLISAVDARVAALAPIVFDVLHMQPQVERQKRMLGKPSEKLKPYTDTGVLQALASERGQALQRIVDPYAYRSLIGQPKLLVLATNDPFWSTGALNEYWSDLQGDKFVLYLPNMGHGASDVVRLSGGLTALLDDMRGTAPMPKPTWGSTRQGRTVDLTVQPHDPTTAVRAWTAIAPSNDLRDAVWTSQDVQPQGDSFPFKWTVPNGKSGAAFLEIVYDRPTPFSLTTTMMHVDAQGTKK